MANDNDYNKISLAVFALAFEVFYCPLHLQFLQYCTMQTRPRCTALSFNFGDGLP